MDFTLTAAQRELKAAARHYLSRSYPPIRIAELSDSASYDSRAWPELGRQGWLDPELSMVELAMLAEEGGRALHPVPWWSTVGSALPVYQAAGMALPGPASFADGRTKCVARQDSGGWVLEGTLRSVVDARVATEIIVAADTGGALALFGLPPDSPGVTLSERAGVDPLRRVADLELRRSSARLLVPERAAAPVLATIEQRSGLLLACEAVGVADRVLEFAVDYAKTRVQFDRPIGSYQAVAHQLADSYAAVELARSLAYRAACVLGDQPGDAVEAIACATSAGVRAAVGGCEVAMQVAGGLGVTWEYPLHRWYRRALFLQAYTARRQDPLTVVAAQLFGSTTSARASDGAEGALAST